MSLPFKLFRLQQIDSHFDRVNVRLGEIQLQMKEEEALQKAIGHEADTNANLQIAKKNLSKAEENVKEQRIKIETNESSLYSGKIRNPKELQDLQNDISSLKRFLAVLEDRQLETMIAFDEAEQEHNLAVQSLSIEQDRFNQNQKSLLDEEHNLQYEASNILAERQAATNTLGNDELIIYEQIRKQKRGIAVAKILNKSCSACGSTLNASLYQAAFSPNQITRCDTCGRILYAG